MARPVPVDLVPCRLPARLAVDVLPGISATSFGVSNVGVSHVGFSFHFHLTMPIAGSQAQNPHYSGFS
jgi:hypothetical protein